TMSGFMTSTMRPRTDGARWRPCRHRAAAARPSIIAGSFSTTAASARMPKRASPTMNSTRTMRKPTAGERSPKRRRRCTRKRPPRSATPRISSAAHRAAAAINPRSRFTPFDFRKPLPLEGAAPVHQKAADLVDNLLREHLRDALQLGFVARHSLLARGDDGQRGDAVVGRKRLNIGNPLLAVFGARLGVGDVR